MAVLPTGIGPVTGGYQIERSLRFNSADSAYIVRQNGGTAGNRKVWTLSFWMKPSVISTAATPGDGPHLFMVGNTNPNGGGGPSTYSRFLLTGSSNNLVWGSNGSSGEAFTSTNVFRDLSAWYHVVVSFDATNTIIRCYVNNQEITYASRTNPSNTDSAINAANYYNSFGIFHTGDVRGWNGYLTEFNFIDGQALTPSSFGETDSNTGVWKPKAYSSSYGTHGAYLKFADNSGTTSTTLGKDSSGNGNNWTPNNFSVTAGSGNDSLVDTPTSYGTDTGVGGEVRGNYATFNPLAYRYSVGRATETNGNLESAGSSGVGATYSFGTIGFSDGKFVAEATLLTSSTAYGFGVCNVENFVTSVFTQNVEYLQDGSKTVNGSNTSYGASYTTNDVIRCEVDVSGQTVQFFKNGTSQGTITSVTFTTPITFYVRNFNGSKWAVNFGQRPFANTATSGFKALCTQNLPTPTIGATSTTQAGKYFNAILYTGTGSSNARTGVGFQPDFVWIKERSGAADHGLYDAVRGVQKQIESNRSDTSESTQTTGLTAFNSDGFTVGSLAQLNTNTDTYVAWNWKANGAGSSNTAGTITSTVSANTTSGFSIVTYTGNGTSGATIGHGLGVTPSMIMIRVRNSDQFSWGVYHASVGNTAGLYLNLTNAANTTSVFWNNTSPTSSVFSVGNWGGVNGNTSTYVAYCFAPVAGYSAFGSYTGNGSADGPFIYTGFKPKFVMVKQTNTSGNSWWMFDGVRSPTNAVYNRLAANLSDAEYSNSSTFDFLSNGFKLRFSDTAWNGSGSTYIYAAFAESPFKYSLAR